jgi:Fe2+ transport system protein FeoA
VMPLSMVRPGLTARIVEKRGGRNLSERLAYMGSYPAVEIEVIKKKFGPLILNRGGARLGLAYGTAHRILASPIPEPKLRKYFFVQKHAI